MKYIPATQKTSRKTADTSSHEASAGSNGIAIAPPAYGIDFVDRDLADAGSLSVNPPSPIQAKPMTAPPGEGSGTAGGYKKNKTGLPDNLKAGIESLSSLSMDDVRVHYNSAKAAQLQALAYTQGTDIHVGPGQERNLPHEAWHVVQQKQGRVKPTMQMKGKVNINDDAGLEKEADVMGAKALQMHRDDQATAAETRESAVNEASVASLPIQCLKSVEEFTAETSYIQHYYAKFWKSPTTERMDPKTILETIDELLGECHEVLRDEGGDKAYIVKLQLLLNYLKGDAKEAEEPIARMQLLNEEIPQYAEEYIAARTSLETEVEKEIGKIEQGLFPPFERATEDERAERLAFAKAKYPTVKHLLAGIPLTNEATALKKLLQNFYRRSDFTYQPQDQPLFTGGGSCWTVCDEFAKLAKEALGIDVTSAGYTLHHVRVEQPCKIIGVDMVGNVDGGSNGWMWDTHAIVDWKGTTIDVLYGLWGRTGAEVVHEGRDPDEYWIAEDGPIYRSNEEEFNNTWENKYTKDPTKARQVEGMPV